MAIRILLAFVHPPVLLLLSRYIFQALANLTVLCLGMAFWTLGELNGVVLVFAAVAHALFVMGWDRCRRRRYVRVVGAA